MRQEAQVYLTIKLKGLPSADHERDWPPCKVVFFGFATNALNVSNNNNELPITAENTVVILPRRALFRNFPFPCVYIKA